MAVVSAHTVGLPIPVQGGYESTVLFIDSTALNSFQQSFRYVSDADLQNQVAARANLPPYSGSPAGTVISITPVTVTPPNPTPEQQFHTAFVHYRNVKVAVAEGLTGFAASDVTAAQTAMVALWQTAFVGDLPEL